MNGSRLRRNSFALFNTAPSSAYVYGKGHRLRRHGVMVVLCLGGNLSGC
jgi:hypothetical protein